MCLLHFLYFFFFFNDTATTEIYTLSLHDALPILARSGPRCRSPCPCPTGWSPSGRRAPRRRRSEEHTSELQSPCNLVCRLLLEKKKEVDYRCGGTSVVFPTRAPRPPPCSGVVQRS